MTIHAADLVIPDLADIGGAARRDWRPRQWCWPPSRRTFRSQAPCPGRSTAARASSISAMPPLVMPWRLRKPSSVCTNTSKIALPIARTSYFVSVIRLSCCWQLRRCGKSVQVGFGCSGDLSRSTLRQQAMPLCLSMISAQTRSADVQENRCPLFRIMLYTASHDPFLPHRIHGHAGLAAIGICA